MSNYLVVTTPLSDQQTTDLSAEGFTDPRKPCDGSAQAIVRFDGAVPASFAGITVYTYDQILAIQNAAPWVHPGWFGH